MSEFGLTPFEMKMLLHYHACPGLYTSRATPELMAESHRRLVDAKLIHESTPPHYAITERGIYWVEKALSTPLPVRRWVWE
jgi:hypothetical protein